MDLLEFAAFALAVVFWSVGMWSILGAYVAGRRATAHLDRAHSNNYLRNLYLRPHAPNTGALLGKNEKRHTVVRNYVVRTRYAMAGFVIACAIAVILSLLRYD
ncbi:hypothetical protein W911_10410 [Hyphomicrobium nitrativorans NL23]|uniref:Universal stress protein B n=1 Tax=Hyphomicrobium nitrativorans NL23 TaxID=1029756 RepID=V5SI60_9HYPH|nr:hypothetical protein [Hyphomicrobium nitrativorans]AHB50187.1 hypothetical protein W911_10410 [Hyphomicrobium nitrativorans NL23]